VRVSQFRVDGLGHLSTLIVDEANRVAAVVDPRRDVDIYLDAARLAEVRITDVLETHLHNDYVSGGRELASLTGARHAIGAGAALADEHRPLRHGDVVSVGSIRFEALETPGHTPEHVSYAVVDPGRAEEPFLLLTGGSLLVGAVGRTDLLGQEHAHAYAVAMYHSLHDVLLRHQDSVMVYPTHGAGSLCSTGIASTPWSTIGYERRNDPLLVPMEVDLFARALLAGQPTVPRYFARMRPINQAGPPLLGGRVREIPPLAGLGLTTALDRGGRVIDARPASDHARERIPGSLSIPAGSSFGTWLGWMADPDQPTVLLVDDEAVLDDLSRQAARIGFDSMLGHVDGGLAAWRREGRPTETGTILEIDMLARELAAGGPDAPLVIDVRQASEYEAAHLPGSIHIGAGELTDVIERLTPGRPIVTICNTGYRASVAASALRAAGRDRVTMVAGGVPTWEAAGYPVEHGPAPAGQGFAGRPGR
jgi:hydroxyacylglutathione hydrolase